jgi:hypothetical protein
LKPKQN